jgi:D-beta-D-heptose 7-phosphate kinase/D-beta-D-heptose 1-phosphate adenosyltransferase
MPIDLALALHRLPRKRVLVVGDRVADVDRHGSCSRYAQEAEGCPVFAVERTEVRDGGAGAVAATAEALGADVEFLRPPYPSTVTRHFAGGRQVFRSDSRGRPMDDAQAKALVWRVGDATRRADAVLIADYGKGCCTPAVLRAAIDGARASGIPCVVDPARGRDWSAYDGAAVIKCNHGEWDAAGERTEGVPVVVRTEGARGMSLFPSMEAFPARPREVVDVTGAGDAVLAALGVCLAGGMTLADACRVANAVAGVKVGRRGASIVTRCEAVADLLHGVKILPPELLPPVLASRRAAGRRVAFTNGCFDLLHAGHVQCLAEARAQADLLVVGLNSDASVRSLKGPTRPANEWADRAAVLAALASVDLVVGFDAPTPLELIRIVRPDVLVKGADYRREEIAGADFVESCGGRVHLAAMRGGRSTTATLARAAPSG